MAALSGRKPSGWWETGQSVFSAGRLRPIMAAVEPLGVILRLKNEHTEYRVRWSTIQLLAVQAHVEAERERKERARK